RRMGAGAAGEAVPVSGPHFDVFMYPVQPINDYREFPPGPLRPAVTGTRNGQPKPVPYEYRRNEAGRDAQIAAQVAEARRRALAKRDAEDEQVRQQRA